MGYTCSEIFIMFKTILLLRDEQVERMDKLAKKLLSDRSKIVRQALDEFMDKNEKK